MELQQLRAFLSLAKHKRFTIAAKKIFRTQSCVSIQIKALENELETKLFDRSSSEKIDLTHAGKLLFDLTSPVVDDFDAIKTRFNELRGKVEEGNLTIATRGTIMTFILPEIIKRFKELHPKCKLTILTRDPKEILTMINNGEADIGICPLYQVPKNIEYYPLARYKRMLITSKNHPLSKKEKITLKDIAQYPLILPTKETFARKDIDQVFKANRISYDLAMEVVLVEASKIYVGLDVGTSIVNEYYLTKEDFGKLSAKNISELFGQHEVGIILKKGKYLVPLAKEFRKLLFQHFGCE